MKEDLLTILFLMSNIPLSKLDPSEQKRLRRSLGLYLKSLHPNGSDRAPSQPKS